VLPFIRSQARRRVMVMAVRADLHDSVQSGSRVAVEACSAVAASLGLHKEVAEAKAVVGHMEAMKRAHRQLSAAMKQPTSASVRWLADPGLFHDAAMAPVLVAHTVVALRCMHPS